MRVFVPSMSAASQKACTVASIPASLSIFALRYVFFSSFIIIMMVCFIFFIITTCAGYNNSRQSEVMMCIPHLHFQEIQQPIIVSIQRLEELIGVLAGDRH